ncbi:globin [Elysia marginata]|uniref:Globin n=1 Tax=Elysia marginata TaxID=1093978 RepID=A0AAV4FW37_9GAST|nr:globin [Elysia marginata]
MGSLMSYLLGWVKPQPTFDLTPDPVTGLSEKDCHSIMESWALVADRKIIKQTGVAFFIALFEAYPYMQDFFPKLKGRPLEKLKQCPVMMSHATTVMYALKAYVEHVDDTQALAALVTRVAKSHLDRNIFTQDMDRLAEVFLAFMKSSLGDKWTTDVQSAWTQLLQVHNVLYKQIEDQTRQCSKQSTDSTSSDDHVSKSLKVAEVNHQANERDKQS